MNYFLDGLKNYFNFKGRASRKQYWMFSLFQFIFLCAVSIIDVFIEFGGVLPLLFNLAIMIPSLSILVRRLHDINKSGWFALISFIPFGNLYLLFLVCKKGTEGQNKFDYSNVS